MSQADLAGVGLARLAFLVKVGAGAAGQFFEIHLVGVEFRAVYAGLFTDCSQEPRTYRDCC